MGGPTAVVMIHSFSAAEPDDPSTIAGRWLANGSFVFFGSMNEPYLDAFRTPRLVGELIALRVPLVVAARQLSGEMRGTPWRLVFLGDPLYRVKGTRKSDSFQRLDRWEPTSQWPDFAESPRPTDGGDDALVGWSRDVTLSRLQGAGRGPGRSGFDDLAEGLLEVNRAMLPKASRPVYDSLLTEVLLLARRRSALKARLLALPEAERSPSMRRTLETLLTVDFHLALTRKDAASVRTSWLELMKTNSPLEFKQRATALAGQVAEVTSRFDDWQAVLEAALRDRSRPSETEMILAELKRIANFSKANR